jgi:diketogulonate reductase-like aldo/keto reductase
MPSGRRRRRPTKVHADVARVEENIAADGIELTAEQIDQLDGLTPAAGDHHNEAQMRMIDR